MRRWRGTNVSFLLAVALCSGCIIQLGDGFTSSDDPSPGTPGTPGTPGYGEGGSGAAGPGQAPSLPEPDVWQVEPPEYTPEQQQRKQEVDAYLAEQLRNYPVVEAIQGYSGDITYWVKSDALPQVADPETWEVPDLMSLDGAVVGRTELELFSELRGPAWTPIHRPDFSAYILGETGATSLQDYLEHYQVAGQPEGERRLYAGLISTQPNRGASGTINQFAGDVEKGTFSLIEIAVTCPAVGDVVENIGVAIVTDRVHLSPGDGKPRLHVEFMTQGGNTFGHRIGGWDERQEGFVPYPGRPYGPGGIVAASVPGLFVGAQQEHRVDIIQAPSTGDWWIAHNGNLLGYYPVSLFHHLDKGACRVSWYGEVYDPTPTDWTSNNIGSGEFPEAGFGYAAYVRDPVYLDLQYTPLYPVDYSDSINFNKISSNPFDTNCYKRSVLSVGASPWSRYLYLGGPGGDAPGCD